MSQIAKNRPRRRFTLLDAVVLVAALGLSFRLSQWLMAAYTKDFVTPADIIRDVRSRGLFFAPVHVTYWFQLIAPPLAALSLALVLLRWVPPRPGRRRAFRQPGMVASVASLAAMALVALGWGLLQLPGLWGSDLVEESVHAVIYPVPFKVLLNAMVAAGAAVGASWLLLLLGGRWQSERDWIDRAGRIAGVLYLASMPIHLWSALMVL